MKSFLKILSFVAVVSAQSFNVTVNETDTSQITFGGGAGDASLCKFDAQGNQIIGGQPGCYNVQPQPPCTEFAAMGQLNTSFASWKFKGSALYITSLLSNFSPLFNVDIDGNVTEVDGAQIGRDSRAFTCFSLFSVQGLDPTKEHTVNLTIKGSSPNSQLQSTTDDSPFAAGPLSLISYTYTASNDSASTSPSTNSSASNSTDSTGSDNSNATSDNGSDRLATTMFPALVMVLAVYFGIN
ncbi:hypothetical protein D9758_005867 [Tetrapyrgos nigripes]|uniref:Uncharacterized protein n=1 Tax=Tetrapyrgos nigripes TaxID=182062 RepID=A0A8H5G2Z7_9AGAR|nr:hypothetical protein D9758_005867 [Tetrapyrgos nigripes]